eukprot:scaffold4037_cov400-Prasinococcus_capsulatus_cf.AAC.9
MALIDAIIQFRPSIMYLDVVGCSRVNGQDALRKIAGAQTRFCLKEFYSSERVLMNGTPEKIALFT